MSGAECTAGKTEHGRKNESGKTQRENRKTLFMPCTQRKKSVTLVVTRAGRGIQGWHMVAVSKARD